MRRDDRELVCNYDIIKGPFTSYHHWKVGIGAHDNFKRAGWAAECEGSGGDACVPMIGSSRATKQGRSREQASKSDDPTVVVFLPARDACFP